ncbi:MAG: DUF4149 domain-containing protein [Nitrospinae bacterium]|nr:DUF4149 domain-containing protein [Nitrospinota bacterium]
MKRLIFISNWLYMFSLSLWVAGMFLLGILVEIMVRINLKDQKLVASTIMNKIMDVFNIHIIYTCITIIVLAEVIKFLVSKYSSVGYEPQVVTKRRYTREIFLAVMIVLAIYVGSVLRPEMHAMDKLKKANPADQKLQIQFDRYHSQLTWLYTINMVLGLSLFYIHGKEMTRFSVQTKENS